MTYHAKPPLHARRLAVHLANSGPSSALDGNNGVNPLRQHGPWWYFAMAMLVCLMAALAPFLMWLVFGS